MLGDVITSLLYTDPVRHVDSSFDIVSFYFIIYIQIVVLIIFVSKIICKIKICGGKKAMWTALLYLIINIKTV